jgi:hypothetical protein
MIILRQGLAPRPDPDQAWLAFLPIFFLVFIATAASFSAIETLALALRNRWKVIRNRLTHHSSATVGPRGLIYEQRSPVPERGDDEFDQWLAWVAALNARRKLRCVKSAGHSAAAAH